MMAEKTRFDKIFVKIKMVYKDLFYGTVANGEIEFIQNSDRQGGFIPQKFVARKVEKVAD